MDIVQSWRDELMSWFLQHPPVLWEGGVSVARDGGACNPDDADCCVGTTVNIAALPAIIVAAAAAIETSFRFFRLLTDHAEFVRRTDVRTVSTSAGKLALWEAWFLRHGSFLRLGFRDSSRPMQLESSL